jgi:hypothetical protein
LRPRSSFASATLLFAATACLSGCAFNPSLNLMGSYFPGWLFCILVASFLTLLVRFLLLRYHWEHQLAPLVVTYPAMAVLFCLSLWLILFGVR